ncbi:MAG: cytochrome c2 [Planctomycetota bacterium]|jgi:cytochrome c2
MTHPSISFALSVVTIFITLALIPACGGNDPADKIVFSSETPVATALLAGATPEIVEQGARFFGLKKCHNCHKTKGTISTVGPVLAGVKDRLDIPHLEMWIRNPRRMKPGTLMTSWDGTDEELIAVIAYLRTL